MKKIKKGFTIVELVIVIGVIAILSAILIPTFVNLTDKARDSAKKQDVSNAYTQYVVSKEDEEKSPKAIEKVIVSRQEDPEDDTTIEYYVYKDGGWTTDGAKAAYDALPSSEQTNRIDQVADFTVSNLQVFEAVA